MIYNNYHKHTHWSNILIQDSVCTTEEYAIRAVENGGKILSSLEHGWQGNYYETYEIAQKYNLKFIFGVEAYWVKDRNEKDKINNHICIFAKNENGRRAINKMLSEANKTGYYYRPRVDFELLFSLPFQDVFITTACIGFYGYGEESWDIILKLKEYFKENIMLEIQCHQSQKQIELNQKLLAFSKINNMQLIVGLDSHYINTEDKLKRQDYLEGNNIIYKDTDEEEWFMDYPTTDIIIERLKNQNIFTLEDINKAIENTNIFLTFEDITFNSDTKMISLYPNETQEQKDKHYKNIILNGFKEYIKENDIPIKTAKELYIDGIRNEVQTVIDTKMSDYFLLDYELVKQAKANGGIITTTGRGCFTKNAIIPTLDTLKTIDNIKIGDKVIGADGKFHNVLETYSYPINEELVEFEYERQGSSYKKFQNQCTLDHKILVNRNNVNEYISSKDLKVTDLLCSPKLKMEFKDKDILIDLLRYNTFNFSYDDNYIYEKVNVSKEYKYSPKWFHKNYKLGESTVFNISKGSYFNVNSKIYQKTISKILEVTHFKTIENYIRYCQKHSFEYRIIPRYLKLDYLTNIFIGMLYGDGWNIKESSIGLAINNTSKNTLNKYVFMKIAERFGCKVTSNISKTRNLIQLTIHSKIISKVIGENLFKSAIGVSKQFNQNLFNQNLSNLKGIYIGLLRTDGSINIENNKFCFDNTSLSLINAFRILDNILKSNSPLALDVRLKHQDKRNYYCSESYKVRRCLITKKAIFKEDDKYWYLPVTKIKILPKTATTVYDLKVEDSHSYVIGNIVVHNSCGSYFTNTLLGLSKMDRFTAPITLYPERFMSKTRILETKSLPDLDLNVGNQEVFAETQEQILGENHSYPMIAFGLLKTKSAFKMYARAKNLDFTISNNISNQLGQYEKALSYAEEDDKDLIDIEEYVDKEYMSYVDESKQYQKIVTSKSGHPCGFLLYQGNIDEEIGLIKCKSESTGKETLCTVIDGRTADKYGFLKNDLLKVDVVMLNYLLYKSIGMEIPTTNQLTELIDKDNGKTWDIYKNGITCCINQFEKEGTTKKAMKYSPRNVAELAYFIAAIRPAFKSLYPKFEKREHFEYGIKSFDDLLQTKEIPDSWILMQEQLMKVLGYAGIPLDMTYEIIKNISKKKIEKVLKYKEMFLSGFAQKLIENKDCEEPKAKELAENIWNIVNNFCSYGFNASHSLAYSYDSLYTAYFKANYPLKFYEITLNYYSQKKKKDKVALLCQEAIKFFNINILNIKFGNNNTNFNIQDEKSINKDILSIKGFGTEIGTKLYEIGKEYNNNNTDESFPIIYQKLLDNNIGKSNLDILIKLDYFSAFGKAQKLLSYVDLYNEFYGKKTINKTKEYSIPMETIKLYCGKETEKQLGLFNFDLLLQDEWDKLPNNDINLNDRLESEIEYLGYLTYTNPKLDNTYMVTSFETPYSKSKPTIEMYNLSNGETIKCKIKDDRKFDNNSFSKNSFIKIPKKDNPMYAPLQQQYRKKRLELTEGLDTKDWSKKEIAMKYKWVDSDNLDWVLMDWEVIKQ